jgi:hypothetical protein
MHRRGSRWGVRYVFLRDRAMWDWKNCGTGCGQPPRPSVGILGNLLCAGVGEASSADRGSRGNSSSLSPRSAVLCRTYRLSIHRGRPWQQGRGSRGVARGAASAPTPLTRGDSAFRRAEWRCASRSSLGRGVEILTVITTISRQASH